jgi:hypothetical protein
VTEIKTLKVSFHLEAHSATQARTKMHASRFHCPFLLSSALLPLSDKRLAITSADNFGPLLGDTSNGRNLWYLFISVASEPVPHFIPTPRGLIRGTVELPPITINGQSYEAQSIPFERRVHTEISPVNC